MSEKRVTGAHKRAAFAQVGPDISPLPPTTLIAQMDNGPMHIFVDGKLRPGTYKVQNLTSKTYLEVLEHSKELCCRPAAVLAPKDGLVIYNIPLTFGQLKY